MVIGLHLGFIGLFSACLASYADFRLQYTPASPPGCTNICVSDCRHSFDILMCLSVRAPCHQCQLGLPDNWPAISAVMEHVDPADSIFGGLLGVYSIPLQLCGFVSMGLLFLEREASKRVSCLCVLPSAYAVCLCASYHIQVTHVGLARALPSQEGMMIFQLSLLSCLFALATIIHIWAANHANMPNWFFLLGNQGVVIVLLLAISKCFPQNVEKAIGMMSINLALVVVFAAVLWLHLSSSSTKRKNHI